nr:MAG: hypothetical protein 1 [Picornavirales sp.]
MDTSSITFVASSPVKLNCSYLLEVCLEANRVIEKYQDTVSYPTYVSIEGYRHSFKQFLLATMRDPSKIWRVDLPFDVGGKTTVKSILHEIKAFVHECFSFYAQARHEEARNEILVSGGYVHSRLSDIKRKLIAKHPVFITPVSPKKKKSRVVHRPNKKCNRMTAVERKMNAHLLGRFGGDHKHKYGPKFPIFQSGGRPISFVKNVPKTTHAERDLEQAQAVKRKEKIKRKLTPKEVRESAVKSSRDKRNPAFVEGNLDYQGGEAIRAIAIAVTGFAAGTIAKGVFNTARKAGEIVHEANKLIKSIKSFTKNPVWMIPIACIAAYFLTKPIFHFANKVLVEVMVRLFPKPVWTELAPVVSEVHFQDGSDLIGKVMATVCVFSIFKSAKIDHRTMSEFIKRMSSLPRLTESLSAFSGWILTAFEAAINFFRRIFGMESVSFKFGKMSQLDAWNKKVEKVLKEHQTMTAVPSPEIIDSWIALIGEAHELREIYRGTPIYRGICEMYDKLLVVIKPYKGSVNARNNFRVEPEMLLLTGAPGIGKTVLTMWLCAAILKRSNLASGNAESVLREIWQKGCSEYWNGYAGQKALIIDDAFQMHGDKTDKDNDFINVIRAISSWAFPLNFADVESKGAIYFTSQLVIATTNRANLEYGTEVIYDMGAVYRRIGHGYRLKLNPDFALPNGRLDFVRLREAKNAAPAGTFPWHIWSLEKHDYQTGRSCGVERGLEEVINEIADSLIAKNAAHADELLDLANFINAPEPPPVEEVVGQQQFDEFVDVAVQAGEEQQYVHANRKLMVWRNEDDVMDNTLRYRVLSPLEERMLEFTNWLSHSILAKGWRSIVWFRNQIKTRVAKLCVMASDNVFYRDLCFKMFMNAVDLTFFIYGCAAAKIVIMSVIGVIKAVFNTVWRKKASKHDDDGEEAVEDQSNAKVPIRQVDKVVLQNGEMDVIDNVERSSYYMIVRNEDEAFANHLGTGIFVCDSLFVYPEHFNKVIMEYPNGKLCMVNRRKSEFNFEISVASFLAYSRMSKDEISFVSFEGVRAHRNIINSFMRETDLQYAAGKSVSLLVTEVDMSLRENKLVYTNSHRTFYSSTVAWKPKGAKFETIHLPRYFQYAAATRRGHCGSPLMTMSPNLFGGSGVMGVHVAGDGATKAYAVPLTREIINDAMTKLKVVRDEFSADLTARRVAHQMGDVFHLNGSVSMLPICVLDKGVPMAQKTNIYRTGYYGVFGDCGLAPAKQRPYLVDGELKYPMLNAIAPYDTPINLFEDRFDDLVHVAMQKFTALSRDAPRHVMDFDTAVIGDPRLEYFRSIPRATAAGFPYSQTHGSGKKAFFGDGCDYDLSGEACVELRERVAHIVASAEKGIRLSHVFTDFLKDELRPIEKVLAGKTRLISASPLDYTIAFRMYFGCFMASVMKHHVFSGMAPGVCVFTEWNSVLMEMSSMGSKICAGDFKAFDCSEQPPLHWAILRFVNKWYSDGNDEIRKVLWLELVHSRHLGGLGNDQKYIYQWHHSLPSGHPFTTIVNSMYSLCALVYAVTKTLGKPYCSFWTVANALTYGDDNLLNASDEIVELLPVEVMASHMKRLGLTYTSDSKGAILEDWRPADKVTFLKRGFLCSDSRVNAPLELESFLYTFYFCKNKKLEREIFIDVMENALEELSMHGQERWDEFAPRVYELLSEQVVPRAPCQRQSYLEFIKIRSDNWF